MEVTRTQAWILATRPRTLSAAAAPVVAGLGLRGGGRGLRHRTRPWPPWLGALFIQIATNLANDYYDFVKGGDTGERVGPGAGDPCGHPSAPRRCFVGMMVALGLATLTGIYLASVAGWPVIA